MKTTPCLAGPKCIAHLIHVGDGAFGGDKALALGNVREVGGTALVGVGIIAVRTQILGWDIDAWLLVLTTRQWLAQM